MVFGPCGVITSINTPSTKKEKKEKEHIYIHSGKGFNKLIGTSEWQLNMELDISHSLCNLVSLFLNWLHYFEQHQNILYPLTLMWILWEQSSVLARFVTTWPKQESFGKKDILLKKCHHQIDLWERMWSFLWGSVLLLMSSVSAHCGWCHPWNGGPAHCNKGCWAFIHEFFCLCFLNQFECFPILGLRFRGKISLPSLFNPEAGWSLQTASEQRDSPSPKGMLTKVSTITTSCAKQLTKVDIVPDSIVTTGTRTLPVPQYLNKLVTSSQSAPTETT